MSLKDVRGYAAAGRIVVTRHASQRMAQRGAGEADVRNALTYAVTSLATPDGRWKVTGPDMDGDALTLVVTIEGGVIVVTVF